MPTTLPPRRTPPVPPLDAKAFAALVVWAAIAVSLALGELGPVVSPRLAAAWWDACAAAPGLFAAG